MELQRIAAIDDQALGVAMMSESIETYLDAEAVEYGPRPADQDRVSRWVADQKIDGVLIDYNLKKGNFSKENGVVIAARLFHQGVPAVLTTVSRMADIHEAIWFGRYVPAHMMKSRMELIESAFNRAMGEIEGRIAPERKAYRTVVRVESIDSRHCNLIILAHDPYEPVVVATTDLKARIGRDPVEGLRFKAEINIGAPTSEDLFISEVEL